MLLGAINRRSLQLTRNPKTLRLSRRFQSSVESKDFFSSTQPSCKTTTSFSPPSDPPRVANPTPKKLSSSFLKFTAFSAVAATLGTVGYATYAYTADEVNEKTKTFRSSINCSLVDSTATIENLPYVVCNAVMTVSSKTVNTYLSVRRIIEERVQEIADPTSDKLLPDMPEEYKYIKTLVLDLRGTLIHNEWKRETGWRTYKRPGLDDFLQHLAQMYEIVIYSDDQTWDELLFGKLAEKGVAHYLTRRDTKFQDGKHYRDLSKLNRDPSKIIYVSAHALDNCLQPENSIPIKPWNKEVDDTTLIDLIPFLECLGVSNYDTTRVLASYKGKDIPSEFIQRSKRGLERQKPLAWKRRL